MASHCVVRPGVAPSDILSSFIKLAHIKLAHIKLAHGFKFVIGEHSIFLSLVNIKSLLVLQMFPLLRCLLFDMSVLKRGVVISVD